MTEKEALKIIKTSVDGIESNLVLFHQAKGYLKCRDKAKVLEKEIKFVIKKMGTFHAHEYMVNAEKRLKKALAKWEKNSG